MHFPVEYLWPLSLLVQPVLAVIWARRRVASRTSQLSAALESMRSNANGAAQRADKATARADGLFESIDGVVAEANQVRALYQSAMVGHGNAQAIMMGEISDLGRQYLGLSAEFTKETGKSPRRPRPKLSPTIQAVVAEYEGAHPAAPPEMPKTEAASKAPVPGETSAN